MSGILDPKQRVLDTIVTLEGRRQMASGKMKIEYVTFTDASAFYEPDVVSGSSDAGARIYFEACHLPQDQITFEADDSGKLFSLNNTNDVVVKSGLLLTGALSTLSFVTGTDGFVSMSDLLLSATLGNFQKLQSIGTIDAVFEDDEFEVSESEIVFRVTNDNPIPDKNSQSANISNLENVFQDRRFSRLPNFQFLPPLNKLQDSQANLADPEIQEIYALGSYKPMGFAQKMTFDDVQREILHAEKNGNVANINFSPTSVKNNMLMQLFEMRVDSLTKLDVLDFGTFKSKDKSFSNVRVLFAGKVFVDDFGAHTFVKLFTLVLE